jgi:hypothetical protein
MEMVLTDQAEGQFVGHRLAHTPGTGCQELFHADGMAGRRRVSSGPRWVSAAGRPPRHVDQIFGGKGKPRERTCGSWFDQKSLDESAGFLERDTLIGCRHFSTTSMSPGNDQTAQSAGKLLKRGHTAWRLPDRANCCLVLVVQRLRSDL